MGDRPTIKVFYNSACPVCNAGIASQKGKMASCGLESSAEWQDVHLDHGLVKSLNADLEFVRERLHVLDASGQLHVGYNAFIEIWRHSPGEEWKARLSSLPVVKPCLNALYNVFAQCLYRWNRWQKHW